MLQVETLQYTVDTKVKIFKIINLQTQLLPPFNF